MNEEEQVTEPQGEASEGTPAAPAQAEPAVPAPETPPPSEGAASTSPEDARDIEEGKVFAILSYVLTFICIPFFLLPLILRNNRFSLYHAKQCLMLWLAGIVLSAISVPLTVICIGVILLPIAGVFLVVLNIMGLINAVKEEQKPIPVIGKWGEDWFKGLQKT